MSKAEDELRAIVAFNPKDEELSEFEWGGVEKAVRLEVSLRYLSRMELRDNLEFLAGQIQRAIQATHDDRAVRTMLNNIGTYLDDARRYNKQYRDIQNQRIRKRNV